jgi:hypothetical protein
MGEGEFTRDEAEREDRFSGEVWQAAEIMDNSYPVSIRAFVGMLYN